MATSPKSKKKAPPAASLSSASKKINKKRKKNIKKTMDGAHAAAVAPEPPKQEKNGKNGASTSASASAAEGGAGNGSGSEKGERQEEKSSGFIFMCNGTTKPECYHYRVFGLPMGKIAMVEKIKPGTRLFLYDFDLKLLYGIYQATTKGGLNLEHNAFRGGFPAQVKFKIEKDCLPLPEHTFKHAILENYQNGKFTPELNSKQVRKLMSLFQPMNTEPHRAPPVKYVEDWRHPSGRVPCEDQYRPVQVASPHLPPEDSYRSGQLVRAPPPQELRYTNQLAPSTNDPYAYSVQAPLPLIDSYVHSRVPGAIETRHVPYYQAPPIDPYQVDPVRAYQSDNPLGTESVIRYRLVPEIVSRDPLLVRDYRTVTARDGEVLQRAEHVDELYNPERAVLSSTQSAYWSSGHEEPNRAYADSLPRPATNGSAPSTIPVSSLYSFAGATPAYR